MKRFRKDGYTKEQIEYLRKIALNRTNKEITEMFNKKFNRNKTVNSIIQVKYKHNIKSYTRAYTEEQIECLKKITPGRSNKEITRLFNERFQENRTEDSMKSIRLNHGIKTGNTGRFEKGNVPGNTMPVGTEIEREDGYSYVKIKEPNIWKQKHRIVWEKHNGAVPENHCIIFGDGNNRNFNIDNLICVSRGQLLKLNQHGLIKNDADLTRTGVIIVDLQSKISEAKGGINSNECKTFT